MSDATTATADGPALDSNGDGATAPAKASKAKGKAPAKGKASKAKARPPKGGKVSGKAAPAPAPTTQATADTVAQTPPRQPRKGQGAIDPRRYLDAAIFLKQLSDATRLQVVLALGDDGETHVGGLCTRLRMSQPAVSHHLALLRHGGIIQPRRQGKHNFYGLTDKGRVLLRTVHALMGSD